MTAEGENDPAASTAAANGNSNMQHGNRSEQIAPAESPPSIVTVRMVVDGKEVGSIIGKKGENVKRYREESGAKINISDASCAERIVTLTGLLDQIKTAFHFMCVKFEDDLRANNSPGSTLPPVNVRLVIPASQCGSLIGKGGTKIKELRETTGACVQVATDMLPGSTERVVTITGGASSISNCVSEVCSIMMESPPKGATIPYRPKPPQAPMMYGMATAYGMPGPAPGMPGQGPGMPGQPHVMANQHGMAMPPHMAAATMTTPVSSQPHMSASEASMTFPSTAAMNGLAGPHGMMSPMAQQGAPLIMNPPMANPAFNPYVFMQQGLGVPAMNAMNSYIGTGAPRPFNNNIFGGMPAQQQNQSAEMVIPNELIGCIIGRSGAKIKEIRELSGAQIKISNCEEGTNDRKVTITGGTDTISLATYLINTSIEIHKAQLLMASQEQAVTASPATASSAAVGAASASLPQPQSVSQSNIQPQLQSANLATAVVGSLQWQQLQKQAITQMNGQQSAPFPYSYPTLPTAGYTYAAPHGYTAAYDPKTMLAANKLKMLPTPTSIKLDQRYAPY